MENEFELPDYYNTKKPKEEEKDLVKRKCFACIKKKKWVSLRGIVVTVAESRATRYYQAPNSISW